MAQQPRHQEWQPHSTLSSSKTSSQMDSNVASVRTGGDVTKSKEEETMDFKLATLLSIFESTSEEVLLQALHSADGNLEAAIPLILSRNQSSELSDSSALDQDLGKSRLNSSRGSASTGTDEIFPRKRQKLVQPRLSAFLPADPLLSLPAYACTTSPSPQSLEDPYPISSDPALPSLNERLRWKESLDESIASSSLVNAKPRPLVLYRPEDVAQHCPCTLIFNVLDKDLAGRLLKVMLKDSETWSRNRWWLFERIVTSPHKTSYFAERENDMEEVSGWTYNGRKQDAPRRFLPEMNEAKEVIRKIVNDLRKTRDIHPYEVQGEWDCNVAAVNHYANSKESVGWHADKLTYLGPRPTIASLTLGATRLFRIRKIVPDAKHPDTAGQLISISLPHNSLCIMWPPMQEEWKHEVPPVPTVTPHSISGTARINITYRLSREGFSPEETPICRCGVAMVLRCVFKNKANYGRYFYMCYAAGSHEGKTCGEFHWVDMEEKLGLKKHSVATTTDVLSTYPTSPTSSPNQDLLESGCSAVEGVDGEDDVEAMIRDELA